MSSLSPRTDARLYELLRAMPDWSEELCDALVELLAAAENDREKEYASTDAIARLHSSLIKIEEILA